MRSPVKRTKRKFGEEFVEHAAWLAEALRTWFAEDETAEEHA